MLEMIELEIPKSIPLSNDQLYDLCRHNTDWRFERTAKGDLIIMAPTGSETGSYNADIAGELYIWNRRMNLGKVFDSSAGFTLPNGAMRAADAAWIALNRWNLLEPDVRKKFAPICPDFVVELMSPTDRLKETQDKMDEWMANGCRLGWLIDRENELVYIYRANGQNSVVKSFDETLSGEDVLPGFVLELKELQ